MKRMILVLILVLLISSGCTDVDRTRRVLEEQGYTDIEITGYRYFSCSEDDSCSTGFVAKSQAGKRVSGVVCSGYFGPFSKAATIRLD